MAILETKWECDACGAKDDGRVFITVKRWDGRERHFCSYDCYKRYDPDTDIIKGED